MLCGVCMWVVNDRIDDDLLLLFENVSLVLSIADCLCRHCGCSRCECEPTSLDEPNELNGGSGADTVVQEQPTKQQVIDFEHISNQKYMTSDIANSSAKIES